MSPRFAIVYGYWGIYLCERLAVPGSTTWVHIDHEGFG
jgi:hypothetical protein